MAKEDPAQGDDSEVAERSQNQWNISVHRQLTSDQISEIIAFFTKQVTAGDRYARFRGTFSEDTLMLILNKRLADAKLVALARGEDGKLAGIGEMYETEVAYKDPDTQNRERTMAYEMFLTTDSVLHRKGIGRNLFAGLIDESQSDGINTFLFVSDRNNIASQEFIRSMRAQLNPSRAIAIPDPDTIQYLVTLPPRTGVTNIGRR